MKHKEQNDLFERRKSAAEAKAKLLKQFADAPKSDDAAVAARSAERLAIAVDREKRRAERERLRQEENERQLAEAAALREAAEAEEKAKAEAHAVAEKNRIARVIEDQAELKALRDQRYAARKARQR